MMTNEENPKRRKKGYLVSWIHKMLNEKDPKPTILH